MTDEKGDQPIIDPATGTPTTGHEWDGIRELDTPMPRWWLWTFYGTIVWSLAIFVLYPAIPLFESATPGILGYSSRQAVEDEIERVALSRAEFDERIATLPLEEVRADPQLFALAVRGGESAFKLVCAQCHGSGAAGSKGYPNLNDDAWIWGGTLDAIYHTISHGVRSDDPKSRQSMMPAFGQLGMLDRAAIADVTEAVLQLSGAEHDAERASRGMQTYQTLCAACHGVEGQGNELVGAPNLSDPIWLYGGSREEIATQIYAPRHGAMPPWNNRFDEADLRKLTLYVHSLGGGVRQEQAPAEVPTAAEPGANL